MSLFLFLHPPKKNQISIHHGLLVILRHTMTQYCYITCLRHINKMQTEDRGCYTQKPIKVQAEMLIHRTRTATRPRPLHTPTRWRWTWRNKLTHDERAFTNSCDRLECHVPAMINRATVRKISLNKQLDPDTKYKNKSGLGVVTLAIRTINMCGSRKDVPA